MIYVSARYGSRFLPQYSSSILVGCESHQAKVDDLQKEYDRLGEQFRRDCHAEYLKVPPNSESEM